MSRRISVAVGSLVGALALHGAMVACSASGTAGGGTAGIFGGGDARAQSAPSACGQWEVKTFLADKLAFARVTTTDPEGKPVELNVPTLGSMTIDAGWEPFSSETYAVVARRCVK